MVRYLSRCFAGNRFGSLPANSQSLYTLPEDPHRLLEKGTRSPDGRPGKNYWQKPRTIHHTPSARCPPDREYQRAPKTITYYNNSTDTLRNPRHKAIYQYPQTRSPPPRSARTRITSTPACMWTPPTANGKALNWPDAFALRLSQTVSSGCPNPWRLIRFRTAFLSEAGITRYH